MKLEYGSDEVRRQCTNIKEPWRIILQPLDMDGNPFAPCNIDEVSGIVRIVGIREVSKHYE